MRNTIKNDHDNTASNRNALIKLLTYSLINVIKKTFISRIKLLNK